MEREPGRITDGFAELSGGVNSGDPPNIIAKNAVAWAINATMREGFIQTRPKLIKRPLTFIGSNGISSDTVRTNFETKNLQGVGFYRSDKPLQFSSVGGHLFTINKNFVCTQLTSTDRNNSRRPRAYFQQAEQYMIVQDGQARPWIYDGASLRRSSPQVYEVPVGTAMAYGHGRLAVANRREIHLGDIRGGDTEVISFTEETSLDIGGVLTIAFEGDVTALNFVAILNTSTGQGPLMAHTPFGVASLNVNAPRSLWRAMTNFQTTAYRPFGALSDEAITLVNSDAWFRSRDGIRSLQVISANSATSFLNTPQSLEMDRVIGQESNHLRDFSQAILFDNRLFVTVNPVFNGDTVYFPGLAVLDFSPQASLLSKRPPHYDGLWTGLKITKLLVADIEGVTRAFIYALNAENKNELWEITTDFGDDNDTKRIEASFETCAYDFRNPREAKNLSASEWHADELSGQTDFHLQYRPDQFPCWIDWRSWQVCAKEEDCAPVNGCVPRRSLKKQYRPRMWIGEPRKLCLDGTGIPSTYGRQFQARLDWTGRARIKMGLLHALTTQEDVYGKCLPQTAVCEAIDCCMPDDFSYSYY